MSQIVKYNSVSLKVNMKKSLVKKQDTRALIAKKIDLIRRNLLRLSRNFDKLEKLLGMPRPSSTHDYEICNEYNLIIATQKEFCVKLLKAVDVISRLDKKFNEHLDRNESDTTEISVGVEDLIDKLENGILHLPPPGIPVTLDSGINFVSPVGQ